jgi:hypothetical protein
LPVLVLDDLIQESGQHVIIPLRGEAQETISFQECQCREVSGTTVSVDESLGIGDAESKQRRSVDHAVWRIGPSGLRSGEIAF